MGVEIKVPAMGESITEGTVSRWLKKDGDTVRADEPVVELETEKATEELPAPASGILEILVQAGQTIAIGSVVGSIEPAASPATTTSPEKARPRPSVAQANDKPTSQEMDSKKSPPDEVVHAGAGAGELPLSPAARRLAREAAVDVHAVHGTGRGGRVTKEDILAHLAQRRGQDAQPPSSPATDDTNGPAKADEGDDGQPVTSGRETRERMSSIRQRIADRLLASQQNTATLATFNEADMSAVLSWRTRYRDRFREKHGIGLGFLGFFVKACLDALRAFPKVNARIDGEDVVYHRFYNIGVAVSTDRGLMVPVLKDAEHLSFAQIEKQIAEMAQKARDGKITVGDLQGGTFTITNGGVFGSLLSTPILNFPQSGILGMHAIQNRPVAVNDQVVIRPMMYLALSYDHRLIDGREAVLFLGRVKDCIENPERLLLEI
jgi:2-oxoglutarate dehydrogenase E2 component (dihydrolipoamide succinyltransferase)